MDYQGKIYGKVGYIYFPLQMTSEEVDELVKFKETALKEIEELKNKAEKWDKLKAKVDKFYLNKKGEYDEENPEEEGDLITIGEIAATEVGWL